MSYDVTSLVQEVKDRGKDSSFSESLIITYLQATQDGALGHYQLPFMETAISPTLTINALTYTYPTDHQVTLGLKLIDGTQLLEPTYMAYPEFEKRYQEPSLLTAGQPCDYTDFGHVLYWDRPLLKAYVMKFKYLRRPVTLASGATVPDVPVEFRELLVRGGLAGVEDYRENFDIAALHTRKVEEQSEDMLTRYAERNRTTPHRATLGGKRVGMIRGRG